METGTIITVLVLAIINMVVARIHIKRNMIFWALCAVFTSGMCIGVVLMMLITK